jgi:NitT/TauT family transport system permease protein
MTSIVQKEHQRPSKPNQDRGGTGRVGKRRSLNRPNRRWWLISASQAILLALILITWELGSGRPGEPGKFLDEFTVSSPSAIWAALVRFAEGGLLGSSILITFRITVIGFVIGGVMGFLAGIVLGLNRYLASVLSPFLSALFATPRMALIPLFILWFGIGDGSKVALVASVIFFLIFYSTYAGVKDVDPQLIERMKLMKADRFSIIRKAVLPSAASLIVEGLRISAPYALVATVTSEMLSSNSGMGFLLITSATQFDTAGVFASIAVMSAMGIAVMGLVGLLERRLLRWRPSNINR